MTKLILTELQGLTLSTIRLLCVSSQYTQFPQTGREFNLSVTDPRDQSGARSDNGVREGVKCEKALIQLNMYIYMLHV